MGKNSKIEWTDHTFNPWIGCTKVSPGCTNCYAEALMDKRWGKVAWGKGNPRNRTTAGNWRKPIKWDREAMEASGSFRRIRPRVFCASLADWLDPEVPIEWLADLLVLIARTPNLDWLMLTKRPELWRSRMEAVAEPFVAGDPNAHLGARIAYEWCANRIPPPNVWLGTTVEDQQRADERIPVLLSIPAKIRFLSCEPLLGLIDLSRSACDWWESAGIHWVIAGGESGANARPMHPVWATALRDQCAASGVPFLFKQWGAWVPNPNPKTVILGAGRRTIGIDGKPTALDPVDAITLDRVGKKRAGRLLACVTHTEFPR